MDYNPKRSLVVNGETWELHKSASDSTIPFAYERVKIDSFACEKVADNAYIVLVGGIIQPMPNTLETPVKIMMIGFAPVQVAACQIGVNQLRNMHIYKTNPADMAHSFAAAFFNNEPETAAQEKVEISPFPKEKKDKEK